MANSASIVVVVLFFLLKFVRTAIATLSIGQLFFELEKWSRIFGRKPRSNNDENLVKNNADSFVC